MSVKQKMYFLSRSLRQINRYQRGGVRVMGQVDMPIQTAPYPPSYMETFSFEHLALSI